MDTNRRVAVLAVIVVLALGSPLAAAGWDTPVRWESSGGFLDGFTRALAWLGLKPAPKSVPKCDQGSSIDPNGCPKALSGGPGRNVAPGGATRAAAGGGTGIGSNGRR